MKIYWHYTGHVTKMAAMPISGKNPFKNLPLWNRWTDFHKTWYVALVTPAHHNLFKWWPWVDLDLFYCKAKFRNIGFFYRRKWKLLIFQNYCSLWSETYWDNEDMWVLKVKVISWPWPKVIFIWKLKLAFLRNHFTNQSQIFYVSFQELGKWKFIDTMVVTLPRWLPCPYMVKTLQKSSSLEPVDWFPRNLVCCIGDSCPS